MKVMYSTDTNEILGFMSSDDSPVLPGYGLADPPENWDWNKHEQWKYDPAQQIIVLKTGQPYIDAWTIINGRTIQRLIEKYAGQLFNPVTMGQVEGAADVVVQMLHKWVNGDTPTQGEKDAWNSFVTKCGPYFKVTLATLPDEENDMRDAKAAARQAEIDMKNDPEWPAGA